MVSDQIPIPFMEPKEIESPMSAHANVWLFLPATVNFFCYGIMLCGVTTLMSSWDRYRWRTIGIVTAFHICQALTKLLGMSSAAYKWILYFTIYSAYEPEAVVRIADVQPRDAWSVWVEIDDQLRMGCTGYNLILLSVGIAGLIIATWIFQKRDLPAPT